MARWANEEEGFIMAATECPLCNGPLVELGKLGSVTHLRCRNCGHDVSQEPECPTCEGPTGPAGAQFMYDRPCTDPCHNGPDDLLGRDDDFELDGAERDPEDGGNK